jgi:hypothetical protein
LCFQSWDHFGLHPCWIHIADWWWFDQLWVCLRWSYGCSFLLLLDQYSEHQIGQPILYTNIDSLFFIIIIISKCLYILNIILTFLPNDCKHITTEFKFWRSHKSTDWNVSWDGTPIFMATAKKLLMFSIHLKAIVLVFTFFTDPGMRVFTNLNRKYVL